MTSGRFSALLGLLLLIAVGAALAVGVLGGTGSDPAGGSGGGIVDVKMSHVDGSSGGSHDCCCCP